MAETNLPNPGMKAEPQELVASTSSNTSLADQLTQQKALAGVIARIRSLLDLETIFTISAREVRLLLEADRVGVFRFYPELDWEGEFVSEDVAPPWDCVLTARVNDHCFGERYAAYYQQGRVQAVADIYAADLSPCHAEILGQFQVRANLVVPLLNAKNLWGLLCIHQCIAPRQWQPEEIEFAMAIAEHLAVAIEQAELLQQTRHQLQQQKALAGVIARIRESLELESIFKTTAREMRLLLSADRVAVVRFYNPFDGSGEFLFEDVGENWPAAQTVSVPLNCFGKDFVPNYRQLVVSDAPDILTAGLSDGHLDLLIRLEVRSHLVAPLMKGKDLWGLLCLHQCRSKRYWQEYEIEFVKQIAAHLGVALQEAELLEQTRKQAAELSQTLKNLQQTQAQMIQSEKMASLGQLVAGIAHEINNPVNFIHGNIHHVNNYVMDLLEFVQLYRQLYPEPLPEMEKYAAEMDLDYIMQDLPKTLASMKMGTDRIRKLVLSLRTFSRLDEAEMKQVNLHDGLESTLLILQHRLLANGQNPEIAVVKEYGNLPLIHCHPAQLNQVFINILSNAIDAVQNVENPLIKITTELAASIAVIKIADNGIGIIEPLLCRIFDPFFTTKEPGNGTGLGLSISYQIVVETHRGQLRCFSQQGQGSTFVIEIPTAST